MSTDPTLTWLLDGDPAIRWQARRDLLDEPPEAYEPDRARVATEGWGDRLLARQDSAGTWANAPYWPGHVFFELETVGQPSRWNTLRGLRVLRWWEHTCVSRAS